jgi:hypothetical protein
VLPAVRRGQIDGAVGMGIVGYHMITFAREAVRGEQNASFYSAQTRRSMAATAPPPAAFAKLRKSG